MLAHGFTYEMAWYCVQMLFWGGIFFHVAVGTRCPNAIYAFIATFVAVFFWMANKDMEAEVASGSIVHRVPDVSDVAAYSAYYNHLYWQVLMCVMISAFVGIIIVLITRRNS